MALTGAANAPKFETPAEAAPMDFQVSCPLPVALNTALGAALIAFICSMACSRAPAGMYPAGNARGSKNDVTRSRFTVAAVIAALKAAMATTPPIAITHPRFSRGR